ncbi:MAG: c-type cytochrome [Longimicrobiales bacterium]|nr:c-type cytochrome [Longimicrobiales bacterium]
MVQAHAVVHGEAAFAASTRLLRRAALGVAFSALAVPGFVGAQEGGNADHPGKPVYDRWCAECHGVDGDGRGDAAAWMLPRPRDFTDAQYQIRTTPSGALPTDADILRVIDDGMPGTAMPGWESQLSRAQREDLVAYLKSFSRFFEFEDAPEPIEVGGAPGATEDRLANGRTVYDEMECWKCHGDQGRGNGESAPTQTDDLGFPIRPADLTENWLFNGGGSVEAIYTRLRTGLNGTPMPSYADLVDAGVLTNDDLWDLALYVRSLSPEREPEARDVIRAALAETLPSSLEDEAWAEADRFYIPLVGQIVLEPRWFAPTVDGVWVRAVHDGSEVVLRLEWNDPSQSPDPAWDRWRALVAEHVEPPPAIGPDDPGAADVLTLQLPTEMPDGRELPYFLGGSSSDPVYMLRWQSDAPAQESVARGLGQVTPLDAEGGPTVEAAFAEGQWRLMVRRPLAGAGDRLDLPTGTPIPIAFFAQDGSNGETETRGSVSSWYFLWLDAPVPTTVYTLPITATILTAVLGLVVVARARRAERAAEPTTEPPLEGATP